MRLIITAVAISLLAFLTTGCNTMEGMGKDIKKGGQNIENAADRHK